MRNILRELRENAGLTVKEMSEQIGVSATTIRRIEAGISVPSATNAKRIADYFNMAIDEIIPGYVNPRAQSEPGYYCSPHVSLEDLVTVPGKPMTVEELDHLRAITTPHYSRGVKANGNNNTK